MKGAAFTIHTSRRHELRTRHRLPGRRPKLTEQQRREAIKRRDKGVETLAEIGRSYNVSVGTISRLTA